MLCGGDDILNIKMIKIRMLKFPIRECFVGVTMEEGRVSVIQEAGTSCGRGKVGLR